MPASSTEEDDVSEIIKADRRHFSDAGWLKSYWLFSFSDYHDPRNVRFGTLRVFNDDVIAPGTGFPMHPHSDMEIVTVVLAGEMTHHDSMGNRAVIRAGDVQRMSAGTGLNHSEYNLSAEPVHIYQIWIFPDRKGLTPSYDQKTPAAADRLNRLQTVASGRDAPGAVALHADAAIRLCTLEAGRTVAHEAAATRLTFVYVTAGRLAVGDRELAAGDQARLDFEGTLRCEARERCDFVLIDVPS
jgi:quercetin 2,3-dioxygenase